MDTTKWKSVLVPVEVYKELKTLSREQGRTMGGQLKIMYQVYEAYQKKELLKQKETVTRLKDEKSRILQLIRDIVLTDKSTESKIYEIEKEVQGLTNTLTNLGAAAEVKGRIAQKIEKAEIDSREQLHYHKVLHLMTARLKAQQKVLKAKIRTLQLEETESKKELKQLELLRKQH